MPIQDIHRVGVRGLNLKADPTQISEGSLTLADGVRYDVDGAVISRGGRNKLEIANRANLKYNVSHLRAENGIRGLTVYYDQELYYEPGTGTTAQRNQPLLPNYLYKNGGVLYLNGQVVDAGSFGLSDPTTRAKFVHYGQRVYAIDENSTPKVFERTPLLGPNELDEPKFNDNPAGPWTTDAAPTTWTINASSNGVATYDHTVAGAGGTGDLIQVSGILGRWKTMTNNALYRLTYTVLTNNVTFTSMTLISAAGITSANVALPTTVGTHSVDFTSSSSAATSNMIIRGVSSGGTTATFDNFKLEKLGQTDGGTVAYRARPMGIRFPTSNEQVPAVTQVNTTDVAVAAGDGYIEKGEYRIRIALENESGVLSNPSASVYFQKTADSGTDDALKITITGSEIPLELKTPLQFKSINLYVSFRQEGDYNTEFTEFKLIEKSDWSSKGLTFYFKKINNDKFGQYAPMELGYGHPPALRDLAVVNGAPVGLAHNDTVYRETLSSNAEGRAYGQRFSGRRDRFGNGVWDTVYDDTEIKGQFVDDSYLFWGEPGQIEAMENYVQLGGAGERGIGIVAMGSSAVVFSDRAVYTFDPLEQVLRKVYSHVGALSRDSIVATEFGVFFMGTDGVMRKFNGATVDYVANDILPIFARSDYSGPYKLFSRQHASQVISAFGKGRLYTIYPIDDPLVELAEGGSVASGYNIAVAELRNQGVQWAIDRVQYRDLYYNARENCLIAVDPPSGGGYFWKIDEGLVDARSDGSTANPVFHMAFKDVAGAGLQPAQFYKFSLDLNTQGQNVTIYTRVDGKNSTLRSYTTSTNGREIKKFYLPATYKGLILNVELVATPSLRVYVYGMTLESVARGVF